MARSETEQMYFALAKKKWEDEGECEIDDNAVVSLSEDQDGICGAYVQAWVWVDTPESERDNG